MKHFLKFAKYAALACIFLNTDLLVDGACNRCPIQGPPGLQGIPGTPGVNGSCTGCTN